MNNWTIYVLIVSHKGLLHGMSLAMYIVGQERRLVNPPSQVVAGVRTVTTNMNGRDALPRMSRPFAFSAAIFLFCGYFSTSLLSFHLH